MNTYKLHLQYKGTAYQGWQIQPNVLTVQGELNKALKKISKSEEVKTLGSGRTDAGVHALGQVVKVIMPLQIKDDDLGRGLNSLLPKDIQVQSVEAVPESFHPIKDARNKEYVYLFSLRRDLNIFYKDYVAIRAYELDLSKMRKACEAFIGKHDFADFQCVGTPVSSTVREIFECEITPFKNSWGIFPKSDDIFEFRVIGDGFLKQMVRLMMGTLWNIGQSKCSLNQLNDSLSTPTGEKLGPVAPANGLYLKEVFYQSK